MLAEYGDSEWIDQQARAQLLPSWVRRKRFEARLIAIEVGRLFSEANDSADRVPADDLLRMAGISL